MEQARQPTIWYEDLENQRQPCLYYLSSEEDPAGPHLICDWNGPPTNYDEFDLDLMTKMIEVNPTECKNASGVSSVNQEIGDKHTQDEDEHDCDQPNLMIRRQMNSSYTILTEDDRSRLDFLTVPPLVNSLLRRLIYNRGNQEKPVSIPEEDLREELPNGCMKGDQQEEQEEQPQEQQQPTPPPSLITKRRGKVKDDVSTSSKSSTMSQNK